MKPSVVRVLCCCIHPLQTGISGEKNILTAIDPVKEHGPVLTAAFCPLYDVREEILKGLKNMDA